MNSEYCRCPHLQQPSECARERLRDPLQWKCDTCCSTDGIWVCITCGHIGCGRRAQLPALGGGHSKHHYHTFQGKSVATACKTAIDNGNKSGNNHGTKKSKILKKVFNEKGPKEEEIETHCTGHEVCIDIVTKAVHCYVCDDYVLSDEKWLADLREELTEIELRRDATMSIISNNNVSSSFDHDFEMIDSPNAGTSSEGIITQPPGITGLDNLGNTCYMNSVLQMLSHCSGFRSFFRDFLKAAAPLQLSGDCGQRIMRQTTVRLNEILQKHQPPDELALTEATHALLRVLWSGQWRSIKPRYFVNTIWKHGGLFAARKQQDAQEFLGFYLGRVDDELKPKNAKDSVMMDLFGVDQFQQVQCDVCKTVTKRTEPLLGLVLSLPEQQNNSKCDDSESDSEKEKRNDSNIIDLIDCVKSLRNTGRFTGDNKFDCETCKEKKDASWTVTLRRRPQSLLISLRRTLWTLEKGVHKDSRQVRFPLELDASRILDIENEKSPDDDFDICYYNLASVVSHSGSTPFVGHYIAFAKKEDDWFLFNDSSVTKVKEEDVLDAEAFILLYERRRIPAVK